MLRNRVRCATATTGTGAVTIGAAETGFQAFAAAYGANATVQYLIEDGSAWEVGRGAYTFAAGAGTLSRDAVEASSAGGAAIALSGAATVSVTFLASDHIGDWPALVVGRTTYNGATSFQAVSNATGFTTVQLSNAPAVDSHKGWIQAAMAYTIPQAGSYDCQGKVRFVDNSPGVDFGIGIDIANQDDPSFVWLKFPTDATGGTNRFVGYNSRLMMLAAGQVVRLFTYVDSAAPIGISAAELNILRIR